MWPIFEGTERWWKHWLTGWILFGLFGLLCICWWWRIPPTGYAIGTLAVVAALMAAIMENLRAVARFAWIILLFGFLWIEMKAIDRGRGTVHLAQARPDPLHQTPLLGPPLFPPEKVVNARFFQPLKRAL